MNRITLLPTEVGAHEATFRWRVDPATTLHRTPQFTLQFPESIDLSLVPRDLWWTIAMICLHSQWMLLQPCRVFIPVKLRPGEAECWKRLIQSQWATLAVNSGKHKFQCDVELIDEGPALDYQTLPPGVRCATAFSSGKDSLTHAGLLSELTANPILVTTTSDMPQMEDHRTPRRRHVLAEIQHRRKLTLVEVISDYRSNLDHEFANKLGLRTSVNEVTDTFLYTGALIAVAAALGATHLFLAAEAQADETILLDGQIIQHQHCMCSAATLGAIQEILSAFGFTYGSLISPLHRYHSQTLLWQRYSDLSDLQYSCWLLKGEEYACNRCIKCFVLALREFALGGDSSQLGVNWVFLLNEFRDWTPKIRPTSGPPPLPRDMHWITTDEQIARDMIDISWKTMATTIARENRESFVGLSGWRALIAYYNLRRRALASSPGATPGYREAFLKLIDPLLRDRVAAIFAEHFTPADEADYRDLFERSEALKNWIIQPLKA